MVLTATRDPVTGFDSTLGVREAIFAQARDSGTPSFMVESDFLNMLGLNLAYGRPRANRFIKFCCGILQRELQALKPASLYAYKSGGDEVSWIVQGINSKEAIDAALNNTQARIQDFLRITRLPRLRHHRYPDIAGVGFFSAAGEIKQNSSFKDMYGELHKKIIQQKRALAHQNVAAENLLDPEDFVTKAASEIFDETMAKPAWRSVISVPIQVPEAIINALPPRKDRLLPRTDRISHLEELRIDSVPHYVMRFDIANLSGLNSHVGQDNADRIIDHIQRIILAELEKHDPEFKAYQIDARAIDVYIQAKNEEGIARLKKVINSRLYEEIFSLAVSEYAQKHAIDMQGDYLLGRTPSKDNTEKGMGILMAHTPVDKHLTADLHFERLQSILNTQKIHRAALIEKTGNGSEKRLHLYTVGGDPDRPITYQDIDLVNSIPYAGSLRHKLQEEHLEGLFTGYVGLILQRAFGIDMTVAIARQQGMKKLIADDLATEEEILQNIDSLERYDFWVASLHPEYQQKTYNIHDRADTHIRTDERLMSMSLAREWRIIPKGMENISDLVLQAQSCFRTNKEIARQFTPQTVDDCKDLLLKDIRVHVANTRDPDTRAIQTTEQVMAALHYAYKINREEMPESVRCAAATFIRQGLTKISSDLRGMSEDHLAGLFKKMAKDKNMAFSHYPDIEEPEKVLMTTLENAKSALLQNHEWSAEEKAKLEANLAALEKGLTLTAEVMLARRGGKGGPKTAPIPAPQPHA